MRCPLRFRGFLPVAVLLSLAAFPLAACSSGESAEPGAIGTSSNDPIAITFSQTYLSIENRSGVPITEGRAEIVPRGILPPFRTTLPRIENGQRRDVMFSQFISRDGTPFRRGVSRGESVRLSVTDVTGKTIEHEVPFD